MTDTAETRDENLRCTTLGCKKNHFRLKLHQYGLGIFVEIFRMDELIIQDVSGTSSIYSSEIRCFGTRGDWDDLRVKF